MAFTVVAQAQGSPGIYTYSPVSAGALNVAKGDRLFIVAAMETVGTGVTLSDGGVGNTFASSGEFNTGNFYLQAWEVLNAIANPATVITATDSSGSRISAIGVLQVRGLDNVTPSAFAITGGTPGGGTDAISTGAVTPPAAPAAVVGFCYDVNYRDSPPVAGTGFTGEPGLWAGKTGGTNGCATFESMRVTTTTPAAATWTAGSGGGGDGFLQSIWVAPEPNLIGTSDGASVSTGIASITTSIEFTSHGISKSTAVGDPWLVLKGASSGVSTGTADLATSIPFDSGARAVGAAWGALTSWASVVLASPLYTGRGSIVGPHCYWSNGVPAAGDTVYYDPTNMAVLADGEIVATATDFKAEVLWMPAAGQQSLLALQVSSGFVNWSQNVSTGGAAQTTSIRLSSGGRSVSTGRADFGVAASIVSRGGSVSAATARLATAIPLESVGNARGAGVASMLTALPLSNHARARSAGIAAMTSAIALDSRGSSVVLTSAEPFTGIALRSFGGSVSTGLTTQRQRVQFTSAGRSVSIGKASLLTHLPLASRGGAVTTLTGAIQFGATLRSRGSSRSTGVASASTGIAFASASRRVFTGELLQLFPARFGYAVVTPLSQSGAQATEQAYVAGSTVYVEVAYFDSNGVPFVPNVVTYNVTDVVSGVSLVNSTQVIPAESEIITIKGAQNYMVNLTRASEQHAIVVAVTDGFGNTGYGQATFDVVRPPGT